MGLDTTHGAFHGAYSAFNSFRAAVCYAAGGTWPPHVWPSEQAGKQRLAELGVDAPKPQVAFGEMWWYAPDSMTAETHPGLYAFLSHSDCDGSLAPDECRAVADELERLLPELDTYTESFGHIQRDGGFGAVARRFIEGCRLAASRGEVLEFH